jgi:biotin transport system substrate-specific component
MMVTHTGVLRRVCGRDFPWPLQSGARLLLANLLLILAAKIAVPLPWTPVPLTLQTLGVLLVAVLFGARTSALAAGLYLVEGAAGLPVFQPFGAAGAARLFGPTAGYLLSFPVAAFLTGRLMELLFPPARAAWPAGRTLRGWLARAAAMLPGEALMLLCGWAWLAALLGPRPAFEMGVAPFLAGEFAKVGVVAAIALAMRRRE